MPVSVVQVEKLKLKEVTEVAEGVRSDRRPDPQLGQTASSSSWQLLIHVNRAKITEEVFSPPPTFCTLIPLLPQHPFFSVLEEPKTGTSRPPGSGQQSPAALTCPGWFHSLAATPPHTPLRLRLS